MSNIVILVGSVRRDGNTQALAEAFAAGAGERHLVESCSVADYAVRPCTGCNCCFTQEGNRCVQQDDMQKLYPKLAAADVLVIASPVYFYGVSAQLKAVIDRLHTPMRDRFPVKKLALLLVAGATLPTVFDAIERQYQLVLDYFQLEDAGRVLVRGVREIGDMQGHPALEEAYRLGQSL